MTGLSSAPIEVRMDNQLIVIFKELLHSEGKFTLCQRHIGLKCAEILTCALCPLSSSTYVNYPERNFPNQLFTVLEKLNG